MDWRVYYVGGRQFSSRDTAPEDLPRDGVLGVVKYLGRQTPGGVEYRAILSGDDRYFWWSGEWFSNSDPREEIARRYPGALILRGKWTSSEEMDRVRAEMAAAKEAP